MAVKDPLSTQLRARRLAHGWSLKTLAERAGVSAGMLSEVERGTKNPTVRLAYQIAQALGCSLSDLVDSERSSDGGTEEAVGAGAAAVSARPTSVLDDTTAGIRREGHKNPLLHGRLEVATYTLQPGASTEVMAPNRAGTLETVVVLDGTLMLVLDGYGQELPKGSSAAHGVHGTEYRNPSSSEACRFLLLVDTSRC